jgi:hypothetical protein
MQTQKAIGLVQDQPENDTQAQEDYKNAIWLQQPGERKLWYNRFMLYVSLGHKRSLQAAIKQERGIVEVMESEEAPEAEESTPVENTKKKKKLKIVKKIVVNVPGSWAEACKIWRWPERARQYDASIINEAVRGHISALYEGFAGQEARIYELDKMAKHLTAKMYQDHLTAQEKVNLAACVQSIMKQIQDEMKTFDPAIAQYIVAQMLQREYAKEREREEGERLQDILLRDLDKQRRAIY